MVGYSEVIQKRAWRRLMTISSKPTSRSLGHHFSRRRSGKEIGLRQPHGQVDVGVQVRNVPLRVRKRVLRSDKLSRRHAVVPSFHSREQFLPYSSHVARRQ